MIYLAQVIFNLLLFVVLPIHLTYQWFFASRRKKRRHELKMLISQIDHRFRWDRDILNKNENKRLQQIKEKAQEFLDSDLNIETTQRFLNESLKSLNKIPPKKAGVTKEWLELFVVVFGVVMGARSLFLQPFKIPTGSMQPTLTGIRFQDKASEEPNILNRVFNYANYSRRYINLVIEEDGKIERIEPRTFATKKNPWFIFFPDVKVQIGSKTYKFPGEYGKVNEYVLRYWQANYPHEFASAFPQKRLLPGSHVFKKGHVFVKGYLELGDHLFVDRVRLNFVEPKRGDITVFITDGIKDYVGNSLRGRFFIKRLVGIPGDELKISNGKLYLRAKGQKEFILMDGSIHPAFDRINSLKGGYKGYSQPQHPGCQYLKNEKDIFKLEEDEYFMLGDNSENSQDSRFWGVVPRRNIIGRANFVYWPFSRRWGFADLVEPENFESLPTQE